LSEARRGTPGIGVPRFPFARAQKKKEEIEEAA
jgi:hypothetical protein